MSKPATERYRLALIAHHAEMLAEMVREQNDDGSCFVIMPIHHLVGVARTINNYLINETIKEFVKGETNA